MLLWIVPGSTAWLSLINWLLKFLNLLNLFELFVLYICSAPQAFVLNILPEHKVLLFEEKPKDALETKQIILAAGLEYKPKTPLENQI